MRSTNRRSDSHKVEVAESNRLRSASVWAGAMRGDRQGAAAAEIEVEPVFDQPRRRKRVAARGGRGAHLAFQHATVAVAALRQRFRQPCVADHLRSEIGECGGAHRVVGVGVGENEVADRQACRGLDGAPQPLPVREAAARIHHGHRGAADDEAYIGDGVLIGGRGVLMHAGQHMNPGGDFLRGDGTGTGGAEQRASEPEQGIAAAGGGKVHGGAVSLPVPVPARGASLGR